VEVGSTEPLKLGDGPTLILVGVDGSETSLRAAAYAAGLARRQGSRLVVLYVATTSALFGLSPVLLRRWRHRTTSVASLVGSSTRVRTTTA
jgi:nucleotide-binding universal stress UspA family protein